MQQHKADGQTGEHPGVGRQVDVAAVLLHVGDDLAGQDREAEVAAGEPQRDQREGHGRAAIVQRVGQQLAPQPQIELDFGVVFEPIGLAHAFGRFLQIALDFFFQRPLNVPQPTVESLARQQLVVRSLLNQPAAIEHEDPIGQPGRRQPMGDQDRRLLALASGQRRRIRDSVLVSTALRLSSSTRNVGALSSARAIATRCRCPPESVTPRSPTRVA